MFKSLRHDALEDITTKDDNRKSVEELIIGTINTLDPSGTNSSRYRKMFDGFSDTEFRSYMSGIRDKKIKLVIYVPNLNLNLKLANIFKVANDLGLKLFERIKLWDSTTQRYFLTPQAYPVLLLPVRRLKQHLWSKISVPESDSKIDSFSGQVVKPDKGASISAPEIQTILSKGLRTSIAELIRVRGGDLPAYSVFKGQLEDNGSVSLNDIGNDSRARSSVILSTYLKGAHVDNNL